MSRAAMQQALEALEWMNECSPHKPAADAIAALRAALAEQAQPVAIVGTQHDTWKGHGGTWHPPKPPIKSVLMLRDLDIGTHLYTAPLAPVVPQPLTDEWILGVVKRAPALDTAEQEWLHVARAVEAEVLKRMG